VEHTLYPFGTVSPDWIKWARTPASSEPPFIQYHGAIDKDDHFHPNATLVIRMCRTQASMGSLCRPAFQITFDSKYASQYLCFNVILSFSSIMTRTPNTILYRIFPQLFLTPPQLFGFTPHLSSHLLFNPRSSAFLPLFLVPSPFTRVVHSQQPRSSITQ
jgi:hypothetical protein